MESRNGVVPGKGSLYKLTVNNQLVKVSENFTLSNGMCWTKDGETMFFNDSEDRKVYRFNYDIESGTLCKPAKH